MRFMQHEQMASPFALHIAYELENMGLFTHNGDWVARSAVRVRRILPSVQVPYPLMDRD